MSNNAPTDPLSEITRLTRELQEAELYEQQLRGHIVAIRDELAAGHAARALSICNEALNEIDNATDIVAVQSRPTIRARDRTPGMNEAESHAWPKGIGAITLFVENLEDAKRFSKRLRPATGFRGCEFRRFQDRQDADQLAEDNCREGAHRARESGNS